MGIQDGGHVRHGFDYYCKKVLKGCARNHFAAQKRQAGREASLSELSERRLSELAAPDVYATDETVFVVLGERIGIRDDRLAEALARLDGERRDVVLLSYFMGLTDKEIAELTDTVRRTVTHRRTSTLRELRKIMEEKEMKDE